MPRIYLKILPERNFKAVVPKRDFYKPLPERDFLVVLPSRALGAIDDRRLIGSDPLAFDFWGRTNIFPFQSGGVDFTTIFANLD